VAKACFIHFRVQFLGPTSIFKQAMRVIILAHEKLAGPDNYLYLNFDYYGFQHFEHWPKHLTLCAHAEGTHTAAVILIAELYKRPVHVCHVARKEEVTYIISKNFIIKSGQTFDA